MNKIKKPKIRIMGIDPGLANLGMCIIELDKTNGIYNLINHEHMSTKESDDRKFMEDMIYRLHNCINKIFNRIKKYNPDYVAIEELTFLPGKRSAVRYSFCYGGIVVLCMFFKIRVITVHPADAKVNVTGKRKGTKEQVINFIKKKFNLDFKSYKKGQIDHVADAINIADYIINTKLSKYEKRLDKVALRVMVD